MCRCKIVEFTHVEQRLILMVVMVKERLQLMCMVSLYGHIYIPAEQDYSNWVFLTF